MGSGDDGGGVGGKGRRWGWAAGALIAIVLATAATSRNRPKITLFGTSDKPCECSASTKYTGIVEDCCCDYETVDSLNTEVLHPILQDLVVYPFFRYFKVKLWCDCPFWPDDGMCRLRDCSVCECPESEFPEPFKKPFQGLSADDLICQEGKPQATVDRTLDRKVFRGWIEIDNPWTNDDETDNGSVLGLHDALSSMLAIVLQLVYHNEWWFMPHSLSAEEMTYVNLQLNPERYTGYAGPSARRIWDAIYTENCPKCWCNAHYLSIMSF